MTVSKALFRRGLAFAAVVFLAACRAESPRLETRAGELTLRAALDPDPPRQQGNTLELEVLDHEGRGVESAEVVVEANMAAMGAMPAMKSRAEIEGRGRGRYLARFDLGMGGSWQLDVAVTSAAGSARVGYTLTPGVRGLATRGAAAAIRAEAAPAEPPTGGSAIGHYTCSMHTDVRSDGPGKCPICGMDLVPVLAAEVASGEIVVDEGRRQTIGVRTAPVERRRISLEVRGSGRVTYDETRLHEVSVKVPGWIGELAVAATGQEVRRGQTLFTLYSPELYAAQTELLTALASQRAARATSAPDRADYLVEAARQRLRLWDLAEREIAELERRGEPLEYLPVPSPVSGTVIEKMVVAGGAVEPGMKLYRVADLARVWVEADVAESDLATVRLGQGAAITLAALPGREFTGEVSFIYPYLEPTTRTARVRIELANPGRELRPEMFAEVRLRADLGERLVVPQSAVLFAGERRLVFVDLGDGRLRPQPVAVGVSSGDEVEILSGLQDGDVVVASGTFVVAAESRLKSAAGAWQ